MTSKMNKYSVGILLVIPILFIGCSNENELSPEEARQISKEAFIYGFPLVVNYKTLYANVIDKNSGDYKGDLNEKSCEARLFSPEDKAIVTPNSDTPYCMFWSDIRKEPIVFSVPQVGEDRYYSFQLIDLFTHNFAYIGSLTTGTEPGSYLIALEDWEGKVPEGINKVIRSETDLFFTIVRTQLFGQEDLNKVAALQSQYRVETLSEYLGKTPIARDLDANFPKWNEGDQFTAAAFTYLDFVLDFVQVPEGEELLYQKFNRIGIGTKEGFDLSGFDSKIQEAIQAGVKDGFSEMEAFIQERSSDALGSTKIFGTREFLNQSAQQNYGYDNFYLIRAVGAYLGLYGNSATEASYPMYLTDNQGAPLDASQNNYTITFDEGELPPVNAFWSITMYDGKSQLLVDNPLDKYLVNSTSLDDFKREENGSLVFYVQNESPGAELESNWLPAPDGPFYCVMRLYGPKDEILRGEWKIPGMIKTEE
ncbi:DUF1254 domain-containing protein [Algoriphagus pacificus]|uniref:DUF1254 domain-containing protein n=1 Tax=Algoriphagus pacificus TaxID=2811234 RepID=A0ABS3CKD5_9BACT|nr:DUF1254 domain-containing protein [Algoriphagus pacificus]MBN7816989.1 DUF1254 domain-containing protein [Algoriphagus pacificus]